MWLKRMEMIEIKTSEEIHKELMKRATTYSPIRWCRVEDIMKLKEILIHDLKILYKDGIEPLEYKRFNMEIKIYINNLFDNLFQVCMQCGKVQGSFPKEDEEVKKIFEKDDE
jgi:hypothetical protein